MRLESVPSRWPRVAFAPAAAILVALVGVALVQELGSADLCNVHRLTGWPCPTCGSTRLVQALGRGEVFEAVALNPLVFAAFAAGIGLLALRLVARRRLVVLTTARRARLAPWVLVALLVANWLYLVATLPPSPASQHARPAAERGAGPG
ncbi:MAG: DUF2752 domain-containing protein [Planctomycetaceae bacterium]|nr:DUF2752 domain-containing protein [Planctomycetaceae bacterium]